MLPRIDSAKHPLVFRNTHRRRQIKRTAGIMLLTATIMILALGISVTTSRTVRAAVATLVTVTNTTANPAVTLDADRATRIPYASTYTSAARDFTCETGPPAICYFYFTAPPEGYRLVVENVSFRGTLNPRAENRPQGYLYPGTNGYPEWFVIGAIGESRAAIINQPLVAFFDASQGNPQLSITGDFQQPYSETAILTGYLIKCSVAGCPAIQY
jgi:hypothetical protein